MLGTLHTLEALAPMPIAGTLLILGFGCVGQAVLPLLQRHLDWGRVRCAVVAAHDDGRAQAEAAGCRFEHLRLQPATLEGVLAHRLAPGDLLLNLSVGVCSVSLMDWCRVHGVDYLDTFTEPWAGLHLDADRPAALRTNYALREAALALRQRPWRSTAVMAHGANPGLSFHFLKRGLLDFAAWAGVVHAPLRSRQDWAALGRSLDVRLVQVAEYDSQHERLLPPGGEFANTWSSEGFAGESWQPAEIGWGSHETGLPPDGHAHEHGCRSAIYLDRPGALMRVHSRTPSVGEFEGLLIGLSDGVTISDALTLRDDGGGLYRPSACYAYRPCDAAITSVHELIRRRGRLPPRRRLLRDTLVGGQDELGVLLVSPTYGSWWYGSRLTLEAAHALAPYNNATSLQVAAGVLGALLWMRAQRPCGVFEAQDLPHDSVLAAAAPYLGELHGEQLESGSEAKARIARFALDCRGAAATITSRAPTPA